MAYTATSGLKALQKAVAGQRSHFLRLGTEVTKESGPNFEGFHHRNFEEFSVVMNGTCMLRKKMASY